MFNSYKIVFLLFIFLMFASTGLAQKMIEGTVRDAATDETLPSANIIIKDTYRGTITNRDGTYSISIPDSSLPATLLVRYIGYNSQERLIEANTDRQQNFELQPSVTELQELVVTGEDPGIRIMREVIKRKQEWRSKLNTYKAEAYTRQNLSSDTALVSITESVSTVFWDDEKGFREVLKWREQTANIQAGQNFAGVSYVPNFYSDNIDIAGYEVVGVTHPDAFSFYDFELVERLTIDDQAVFHIKAIPKRKLQPLFNGDLYVLDEEYALLKVDLIPNDVVRFPPPVQDFNLSYSQQFSNYGGDFWLPVDARINGTIKIGVIGLKFPRLSFRQISKLTDYEINITLPDSLYQDNDLFSVDSTTISRDSLKITAIERVPLSAQEEQAYAKLDSTQTLSKAFEPTGFLARFVDISVSSGNGDSSQRDTSSVTSVGGGGIPGQFSPRLRYNRVDELFAGLEYSIFPGDGLKLSGNGGYSTGYNEWSYGAGANYRWSIGRLSANAGVEYKAQTAPRYHSQIISPTLGSLSNVLGYENYFDYFRNEGLRVSAGIRDFRTSLSLQAAFNSNDQTALQTETAYDILGRDNRPRINPAINEGQLNSVEIKAGYNLDEGYSFGVVGRKRIEFNIEYSDLRLGSDFDFTRYSTHLDWNFPTFFKRRIFPNTFNISVDAGTFSGQLPLQKFGIVDVAPNIFSPFEALRGTRFQPYEGEQFAAVNLEHNFRTVPFELLGLRPLVQQNLGIIVFGGVAKTWVSDERLQQIFNRTGFVPNTTDGTHYEAGLSLTGILDILRVDFTARLDEPAFLVGVGLTRFL